MLPGGPDRTDVRATAAASAAARRPVAWWVVGCLLALLGLPLLIGLVVLRHPRWSPVLDHAMAELRVRDVGGAQTPLVGLPGRIGTLQRQGSHPGPVSFYLLTPTYRLLGSSAWALQAAAVFSSILAMGVALVLARRRGGRRAVVGVAALLGVLSAGYGQSVLTEPWNPYLPLLWWVVFLLAAWIVSDGGWWALPVAVFAGSLCAQTHLPYLGLTVALGAGAVVLGALTSRRGAHRTTAGPLAPAVVAIALGAVLWSPVVLEEVRDEPGNVTLLREHMLHPPEEPVGLATGARVVLRHLDLTALPRSVEMARGSLVDPAPPPTGSMWTGALVLVAWCWAVVTAWRLRAWSVLRLHAIVGGGLALGVISVSRVFGPLWYYLTLWAWALAGLAIATTVWTGLIVLERRSTDASRVRRQSTVLLAALVVVSAVALAAQARSLAPPDPTMSAALGGVVEPTATALREGVGAATGPAGRYVVTWTDSAHIGSPGYGLVSELERRGFDVGGMPGTGVPLTAHRVIEREDATAIVHLATGPFIEEWRGRSDVVEVASADHRTQDERAEFDRLRSEVLEVLVASGRDDLVPLVDGNLFGVALDPDLDRTTVRRISRMLQIGVPYAVFVAPPDTGVL